MIHRSSLLLLVVLGVAGCSESHVGPEARCCVGERCVPIGTPAPDDPCRVCDPRVDPHGFSPIWSASCGGRDPWVLEAPAGTEAFGSTVQIGTDADGDGHADVLVTAPGSWRSDEDVPGDVFLYSGRTLALLHRWSGEEDAPRAFGQAASIGPDATGDGLADVVVATEDVVDPDWADPGSVLTLFSGATGEPVARWPADRACGGTVRDVQLGPDADGDGRGDVLVVLVGRFVSDRSCYRRTATLFSGGTQEPIRRWGPDRFDDPEALQAAVLVEDLDGDGLAEVAIARPDARAGLGVVEVYSGRTGELLHEWRATAGHSRLATWIGGHGDADGDGLPDLVASSIESTGDRAVDVRFYSHVLYSSSAHARELGESRWVSLGPDATGDGRGDVVACSGIPCTGVEILRGDSLRPVRTLRTAGGEDVQGRVWLGPDVDGDGRADVTVGNPEEGGGRVYLFLSGR